MEQIIKSVKISNWIRAIPFVFAGIFASLSLLNEIDIILGSIAILLVMLGLLVYLKPIKYINKRGNEYIFLMHLFHRLTIPEEFIESFESKSEVNIYNGISCELRIHVKMRQSKCFLNSELSSSYISGKETFPDGSLKSFVYSVSFGVIEYV